MNATTDLLPSITPSLTDAIERVLLLACTGRTTAATDDDLFRLLDAIENAARNACMEYLDRQRDDQLNDDDVPF